MPVDESLLAQITNSVNQLKDTIIGFAMSESEHIKKRASLLSYWICSYSKYIKEEDTFNPMSLVKYNQRNIVQVDFGYRIGSELGGLHYAVVLDNKNSKLSKVITVVPLMSLKPEFKETHTKIKLDYGVYDLVTEKYGKILIELGEKVKKLIDVEPTSIIEDKTLSENEIKDKLNDIDNKIKKYEKEIELLKKRQEQIETLKSGTIADVGQIITVSKQRIYNPKKASDLLYGVSVEKSDFNRIKNKINKNFFV